MVADAPHPLTRVSLRADDVTGRELSTLLVLNREPRGRGGSDLEEQRPLLPGHTSTRTFI